MWPTKHRSDDQVAAPLKTGDLEAGKGGNASDGRPDPHEEHVKVADEAFAYCSQ